MRTSKIRAPHCDRHDGIAADPIACSSPNAGPRSRPADFRHHDSGAWRCRRPSPRSCQGHCLRGDLRSHEGCRYSFQGRVFSGCLRSRHRSLFGWSPGSDRPGQCPQRRSARHGYSLQTGRRGGDRHHRHVAQRVRHLHGRRIPCGLQKSIVATDPSTPHPWPVEVFLGAHPRALKFVQESAIAPTSFGTQPFFSNDSFTFINKDGTRQIGRYKIIPLAGRKIPDRCGVQSRSLPISSSMISKHGSPMIR